MERAREVMGKARQDAWVLTKQRSELSQHETISQLLSACDSTEFSPTEITLMRYPPGGGITPHLDPTRFRYLIVLFSLLGRASFQIVADRQGEKILESFECDAGDVCLLRAPGLGERPLHQIVSHEERISLALRMVR